MKFPIKVLPFWLINKPSVKNVIAEIIINLLAVVSVFIYLRYFSHEMPLSLFITAFVTNALLGIMIEFKTQSFYNYQDTLFSWFGVKDFSLTFGIAYGGLFSVAFLLTLKTIAFYNIPIWINWLFPGIIYTMLITGTVDSIFYNVIRYYDFDPSYYVYLDKTFKTKIFSWHVPLWNLPLGVIFLGYGVAFGVILFGLIRFTWYLLNYFSVI